MQLNNIKFVNRVDLSKINKNEISPKKITVVTFHLYTYL